MDVPVCGQWPWDPWEGSLKLGLHTSPASNVVTTGCCNRGWADGKLLWLELSGERNQASWPEISMPIAEMPQLGIALTDKAGQQVLTKLKFRQKWKPKFVKTQTTFLLGLIAGYNCV